MLRSSSVPLSEALMKTSRGISFKYTVAVEERVQLSHTLLHPGLHRRLAFRQ